MTMRYRTMLKLCIFICMCPALSASAQETQRSVDQYKCKDLMRESGSHRDVAIAFLHGFLLGKSGEQKFDPKLLAKQTETFLEYCLDNPGDYAIQVMLKVKG